MTLKGKGRHALAAAIAGLALWVGGSLVPDPWPGTTNRAVQNGLAATAITLGLAALILGTLDWRRSSARAALGIVLGFVALAAVVVLTVQGN